MPSIGERLKSWRKLNKITMVQIAEKTGIAQSAISAYETNKQAIGSKALYLIASS